MSKRKRKEDDKDKPLALRAADLADWLEDIEESAWLVRCFKRWWNRSAIFDLAADALAELAEIEKKNGMHDKVRRALNTAVMAMGGAELKWAHDKGKRDD